MKNCSVSLKIRKPQIKITPKIGNITYVFLRVM